MINTSLDGFQNKTPVAIKNVLEFNERDLKRRLDEFYKNKKSLRALASKEIILWIKSFKMNSETTINIKIKMDKYEKENSVKLSDRSKLDFILINILELAFVRSSENINEDRGKVVRDFKEDEVVQINKKK